MVSHLTRNSSIIKKDFKKIYKKFVKKELTKERWHTSMSLCRKGFTEKNRLGDTVITYNKL